MDDPTIPKIDPTTPDESDLELHALIDQLIGKDECYILILGTMGSSDSHMIANVPDKTMQDIICDIAEAIRRNREILNN